MLRNVSVYVLAVDGLEWLLAWRQLGLLDVTVVLCSTRAGEQLSKLEANFYEFLPRVARVQGGPEALSDAPLGSIVCCTGIDNRELDVISSVVSRFDGLVLLLGKCGSNRKRQRSLGKCGKREWTTRDVRHGSVGGLTRAKLQLLWSWGRESLDPRFDLELSPLNVVRDSALFLEPSARFTTWAFESSQIQSGTIWEARADGARAPWPVPADLWVHTFSVFFKKQVYRPLSNKEWAQMVDLRPEWGDSLRGLVSSWRNGSYIPLRFLVEFAMASSRTTVGRLGVLVSEKLDVSRLGQKLCPGLDVSFSVAQRTDLIKYFGWTREDNDTAMVGVATTSDDAGVPLHLWAVGGNGPGMEKARQGLRKMGWKWWINRTRREMLAWLKTRRASHPSEVDADTIGIRDCLGRLANSNWFEWLDGSRTHFWRWPERWLLEARDGSKPWVTSRAPRRHIWPQFPQEEWMEDVEVEKLAKLINRRYIERGRVDVVIPRMCVPKGDDDVRVVWDMTRNMVNPGTYASTFYLLGIYSLVDRIDAGMWIADFDCGEMFNNYTLHESERSNFGVYLSPDIRRKLKARFGLDVPEFMRWGRLPFGWRPAPIFAIRMMMRSVELAKGCPSDTTSPYQYDRVVLNLPTMACYDPGKRRVIKLRKDGKEASDVFVFVDDGRIAGADEAAATDSTRRVVCQIQQRGTQDASRKREKPSMRPRAWTGGVVHTDKGMLRKFLVQKKWVRIQDILARVLNSEGSLDFKTLESDIGFLIHASATYDFIRPYLIGFYLAMNQHRGERDEDGWRLGRTSIAQPRDMDEDEMADYCDRQLDREVIDKRLGVEGHDSTATVAGNPEMVRVTELLTRNARTLSRLVSGTSPIQLIVRPIRGSDNVAYAGSDASGEGFGVRDWMPDKPGEFVFGFWHRTTVGSSSNWREMKAALDKMKQDVQSGRLQGREVWFVTDNSTLERAYYKGYSSSVELYEMVEELRALTLVGGFVLRIVHVAGTRMIELGIDGLSRGELELGLMSKPLRDSIPLAETPIERSPGGLLDWIQEIVGTSQQQVRVATPMDWHYNAQQSDATSNQSKSEVWIWDLPPAAGHYALEELAMGRTKRRDLLTGIVLIPNLMMPEWYRRLSKTVDVHFRLPAGALPEWPSCMHESLTVGIYLPVFRHRPWDWKNVGWMGAFGRHLSSMFKEDQARGRYLLYEFWRASHRITHLSPVVVWRVLSAPTWKPLLSVCGEG